MRLNFLIFFTILSGCASFNAGMTPSVKLEKDDFDGKARVYQEPVSAASSIKEGWHTLGFEWTEKFPDTIFLTVGVSGAANISSVEFNVDGQFLNKIDTASKLTEYGSWSTRRFQLPLKDFLLVARGRDVKMKVVGIDKYSVSSFGSINKNAIVNSKFEPFIRMYEEERAKSPSATAN